MNYGEVAGDAIVLATAPGTPSNAVHYAYEAGTTLADGTSAPARRVAAYPTLDSLAVVSGRPDGWQDRLLEVAGAATKRVRVMRQEYWEHNAPISWPPPLTTGQMRDLGRDELPGATFHRLMSNRLSLVWKAPAANTATR